MNSSFFQAIVSYGKYVREPSFRSVCEVYITFEKYFLHRYYKNSVSQNPGWNHDVIRWCQLEAERQQLEAKDHWGGFVLDEMKIQVLKITAQNPLHNFEL